MEVMTKRKGTQDGTLILRPKLERRAQPRIPQDDLARPTPEDGDIVVREEKCEGTLIYVQYTAPDADQHQCLLPRRGEAVAEARALARRQHKRAWLTDEGNDFRLLEDFRFVTALDDVLKRLRREFLEMSCLRLTPEQVQRLCCVERRNCRTALDLLVDEGFLCVTPEGYYARLTTEHRPLPAKASLRIDSRTSKAS
jgi:hypothetical protein